MSELPTPVETDPPPVVPALVTRAKVVRESFTALRSDFEINAPQPVARPQRPTAAASNNNVQNNARMSIGGVLVLVVIAAFLVYGYLPNANGRRKPGDEPSAKAGGTSAAETVVKAQPAAHGGGATVPTHHAAVVPKPRKPTPVPIARVVPPPALHVEEPKKRTESAAETVAIPRPRRTEIVALPPTHHAVAAPAPHIAPPKVVAVVHHEPAHVSAPQHESHSASHSHSGNDIGSGHNAGDITDPLGLGR